jgi:hypothetical protein
MFGMLLLFVFGTASQPAQPVVPLSHAHAHNDYAHPHPLFDALAQGFGSVEADIFLTGDRLFVGHSRNELKPERTLESLYLDPLRKRARENKGNIYPGVSPFFLLIDVKTDAQATFTVLHETLARYDDILTTVRDGKVESKAVTAVLSGNRKIELLAGQKVRYAGIDGRPSDLDSDVSSDLMPWVSERWGAKFKWKGAGPMPEKERRALDEFVRKAHAHGRLVRFWATPETEAMWRELREAGVDLINTDKLAELRAFLIKAGSTNP